MTLDLLAYSEQRALWAIHNSAAVPARAAGACWQCAAEAGCRATDGEVSGRRRFEMHTECERRIAMARETKGKQ